MTYFLSVKSYQQGVGNKQIDMKTVVKKPYYYLPQVGEDENNFYFILNIYESFEILSV